MTGYEDPPDEFELLEGLSYNAYFPGHQIAMAPPLFDDAVEYADGTEATVDQMSRDVSAFLMWTAEPKLEARKTAGIWVLLFFLFVTGVTYASKKKIWANLHKDEGGKA
jgi:ubiquinol-cytochrome c reductase cytochrome c1 subunit